MLNFQNLSAKLDVRPLLCSLERQPELWNEITGRQDYPGSAHGNTKSIFLRWCKGLDINSAFTEIPAFNFPAMGKLPEAHELINSVIQKAGGQELGRVLIVNLCPGGRILPHADEGAYADYYERFHIVLKSEDGNFFRCGKEITKMLPGEVWCFNHKERHEAINNSQSDRIHMIVDMVAPQFRQERISHAV